MLPLTPDYRAMEAKLVPSLPEGPQWQYEPKWDGFRCLAFKDRSRVALRSKSGQSLDRYFPEIVDAMGFLFDRCKLVVEPSGAAALAALLAGKLDVEGLRVGVILSGGNVGLARFAELVGTAAAAG